ncbi:MAG: hypothetical protein IIX08_04600 [Bacteroidales bacterium]|nr:hypothetical protein [Bacteroidales bacterium]
MTAVLLSIWGCNRYDDTDLWDKVDSLEERIARLEKLCNEMNTNISALENIVTALQNNDYVTDVTSIIESGKEIGFTITFSKSGRVVIYHGENGADGEAGEPGQDGADGADGKDGHTPVIGVKKDADGIYYWTLDGEWITDSEGNKIPTTGKDGEDGEDGEDGKPGTPGQDGEDGADGEQGKPGKDGKDGVTPLLKIEDDYWYISYDNGKSWQQLYKAVGEDGAAGANGTDGAPGKDGQSFFQSVDTTNPNYIILTLADGSQIKIPTWKAFEELQVKVNKLNTNLTALQAVIEALENNVHVTGISPVMEGGKEVGYTIYFSDGQFVSIYHGKDGADGAPGQDGEDGKDGADGGDGYTPKISVKQDTDGNYYWTVDGEWMNGSNEEGNWIIDGGWLTDGNGNKIPATGKDGKTPVLKIVDGEWYISYDNGKTWSPEPLGPATVGAEGDIFSDISYDEAYLYITLANGETITLSRRDNETDIDYSIDEIRITGKTAKFSGYLKATSNETVFSQICVYYSDSEQFNIHAAEKVSTTVFDYNNGFDITLTGLEPETKYSYCIYARTKNSDTYSPVNEFVTGKANEFTIDLSSYQMRHGNKLYYGAEDMTNRACTVTNPYLEAGNVIVVHPQYKLVGARTSSEVSIDKLDRVWNISGSGSSFVPGVYIVEESGYYAFVFIGIKSDTVFDFEEHGKTLDKYITVYEGIATHSVTNYSIPYTQWNLSQNIESQEIEEDWFSIDKVFDPAETYAQVRLGWRIALNETPFKVGDIIYFGIEDFEREGGNFYMTLRDQNYTSLGYSSVGTRRPITYIVMQIAEGTKWIDITIASLSADPYIHFSGGRSFLTTEPFHEETIWKEPDDATH